jgi:hypothetical protein
MVTILAGETQPLGHWMPQRKSSGYAKGGAILINFVQVYIKLILLTMGRSTQENAIASSQSG